MIWKDTVGSIISAINAQSIYNVNRSTTPSGLDYILFNQAQDYLAMYKPWRDLKVTTQLTLDSSKKITLPTDFGCVLYVYTDQSNIGKPMWFYFLDHNDIAKRYTEETTFDGTTNFRTVKLCFAVNAYIPANPYVVYSKVLSNMAVADVAKYSFFPMNLMLITVKKMLQDYHGQSANTDPNWINQRFNEEIRMMDAYAYQNNEPLEWQLKDQFGSPVFINGMRLDGTRPMLGRPSPYLPATYFGGGTW